MNIGKTYLYKTDPGDDSSDQFDRAYHLIGKYFPQESLNLGYDYYKGSHTLFICGTELSDEDRVFFKLKTGIHLTETHLTPKTLNYRYNPKKIWVTYDEMRQCLDIKPEEKLFPNENTQVI